MSPVQAEPVKLAVLLPLSNVDKHLGVTAKQGFLLGIEEEAAAHHVDWKSWIALGFLDTRSDQTHSLKLAQDAITNGAKAILGCTTSDIGLALQDYVLNKAGVPFIVFGGCVTEKLRTQHPLFIRTSMSIPLLPTVLARWLKAHPIVPGDKPRWACIHRDDTAGVGRCDAFKNGPMDRWGKRLAGCRYPRRR